MAVSIIITDEPLKVNVPLKPYLIKYLNNKYGSKHKASKTSWLGLEALELLTHDFHKPEKVNTKDCFSFVIPYSLCKFYGHFVDPNKVVVFQKKVERIFKDLLVEHIKINNRVFKHGNVMKSIRDFYVYYSISEEDLSADYAYKLVQRSFEKEVKKRQKKTFQKKAV